MSTNKCVCSSEPDGTSSSAVVQKRLKTHQRATQLTRPFISVNEHAHTGVCFDSVQHTVHRRAVNTRLEHKMCINLLLKIVLNKCTVYSSWSNVYWKLQCSAPVGNYWAFSKKKNQSLYKWPTFEDLCLQKDPMGLRLSATDRVGKSEKVTRRANASLVLIFSCDLLTVRKSEFRLILSDPVEPVSRKHTAACSKLQYCVWRRVVRARMSEKVQGRWCGPLKDLLMVFRCFGFLVSSVQM